MGTQLRSIRLIRVLLSTHSPTCYLLLLTNALTTRRGSLLTSNSHRFDRELNRFAAKMNGKGGEENATVPALCQIVQARLPPISARTPRMCMHMHMHMCM